jgi:serine/threonine protein kinase, bacterial
MAPGGSRSIPLGKTKPSIMITKGIASRGFCAIDGQGNFWVTNLGGPNVTEYLRGSKTAKLVITRNMVYPVGIAIDRFENLYVSNRLSLYSGNIVAYKLGSKSPSRTITDGTISPVGIAVDAAGSLYVTNVNKNNVEKYRRGQNHPYQALRDDISDPVAVTVNKDGWVYVVNDDGNIVVEFPPSSLQPPDRSISQGLYTPSSAAYYPPLLP